ncbi:DoxX family protein [Pyxidicoccus parkwayensis]|uniref:DoxX family protein n=1 Tax=Pyxidicoccus parkwayensis TaxID=2813578 RepID=A0ABX7NRJ5_9BACT|nr:DoxX family protein [Pyxidicoccus parkwaysis]QSQ21058.1 DoxX family protein [Pyxidicoccus parkwaysis]
MSLVAKWGPRVARTLLGLVFFVFGLNFFLNFLPPQPPPPKEALPFIEGLMASGFVFPLIKAIEIAAGLALLSNRFVPLALTLLAPIIISISGFHFLLAPSYALPVILLALELYLAWSYRAAFAPMLRARVEPAASAEHAPAGQPVAAR